MRRLLVAILIFCGLGASIFTIGAAVQRQNAQGDSDARTSSRIRYAGEEAAATKICKTQTQRPMSWWISDPRQGKATMHVRCTGVVTIETEVKF